MRLYLINGSPNGRKTLAVVNHLGIDLEIRWVDLFGGATDDPRYRTINPNGLAPTLVDGDFTLFESNAINAYLCDRTPGQDLYPDNIQVRADINRWLCWELAHFNKCLGIISFQTVAKAAFGLGEPNQPLVDHFLQEFARYGATLENHLKEHQHMVGDDWTIADYAVGHIEMFQPAMPIEWSNYPNIVGFYERLRENPHWVASAAAKHEEIGRIPEGGVGL